FNFTSKADLADSKVDLSFDLYPALPPNLDDVEIVIENGNIERTSRPARLSVVGPVEGGERGGKGGGGEGGDGVGSQRDLAYLTVNQTYSCLLFDCGLEFSRSKPGEGKGPGLVKKRSSTQTFFETQTPMENEPGNLTNKDTGLL
ncbi:hypothetical protein TeGR_g4307, partial [Tetraparma gracilis]